jgi:hypothetical protein
MTLRAFVLPESSLGMGASLGNSALWLHTKGNGAIASVFLNAAGTPMAGTISLRFGAHARPIAGRTQSSANHEGAVYSGLYPEPGGRTFEIHPAYQRITYTLASVLEVSETTFVILGESPGHEDLPIVYVAVDVHNRDPVPHHVRVIGSVMLRGATTPDIAARYDESANAVIAWNAGAPQLVRIFGLSCAPTRYGCDFNAASTYEPLHLHALPNNVDATGDILGRLQLDMTLRPGARHRFCFAAGLYSCGADEAMRQFMRRPDSDEALQRSIAHVEKVLAYGQVLTPDETINRGALWSKVNMRRVMAEYPGGCAFTNDPGKYANVVVRDCAWFIFGNDHFLPSFSRDLLNNIAERQYTSGKLPEYFDAVTGRIEDDGLNINDDTPLYILAVNHHFRASGDMNWLQAVYPSVARAARYIISQINERGLVFCSAEDPRGDVWAIAGWRNIIAGYSISGAVTELNAECVAALRAASHLADNLGAHDDDKHEFADASARVRQAMDAHLINPENGLYYLNIDVQGNARTDVTGDQIFPVIMRACSEEIGFRIISRLNFPDFWTTAGLRTVSREDPRFDPTAYSGLVGGVWPGLTWWYAFGAARYHPDMMVRALRSSFAHYSADPKRNNTVPGQFSEWFDGESLANRGMRLSPWEPPRFLWAAVEGVCGLMLSPGAPRINPLIPPQWSWAGLRNLPYHGSFLSYFFVRERDAGFRVYSTMPVDSNWDVAVYDRDVSDSVRVFNESAVAVALARNGTMAILIGNSGAQTLHTPVSISHDAARGSRFHVRTYNSERGAWEEGQALSVDDLRGAALSIEAGGFRVLELDAF